MNKIIKKDDLRECERHKVESPFFAAGKLQNALNGTGGCDFGVIWHGLSEFAAEHKDWLSPDCAEEFWEIISVLESQRWYLVLEEPFSPLFPKKNPEKAVHQGIIFGGPRRTLPEPEQYYTPSPPLTMGRYIPKDGLTVYLGGAGMEGDYISDQIEKLLAVGIDGAVAGKITENLFFDAAAVLKYRYPARSISGLSPTGPYKVNMDWSLNALGINRPLPQSGQFNLIGYSWGSLVAAQTALFYAEKGETVDHLVLIGSPISHAFLNELGEINRIKRILVIDLTKQNDRIYAGMPETELIASLPSLLEQMLGSHYSGSGRGHFFYGTAGKQGEYRRHALAVRLKIEGLK